jgi:hypothetical protein
MQFERWHSGVSPAAGLKSLPASVRRAASPNEKKKLNEIQFYFSDRINRMDRI